ncbi:uncharacterized protein LOC107775676 [Nicotiana tabacum]|uniref:Uncharacterized protein LOC107775676 n=2 Tax=Nicotiana TaxID=4085 RepID=A0A1S3YFU0_TOBAC|nr:PREDICTED: uncharacterized protein LOC104243376 [Nicotiana sylvestris]XP_016450913.1 PREDICTED: uncharacterized protein LOC107775676 [Nicotiana tabacum]
MTNQRENSLFLILPKSSTPNPNDDKIESQRPSLGKKNKMKSEENHESKSTSDEGDKFNDARATQDKLSVVEEHASGYNKGESYVEDNGRERLKRHRVEVAGHVWIPDIWGQEELLKDWIDCSAFDASLMNSNIVSARTALVEERRIPNSSCRLRIENSC